MRRVQFSLRSLVFLVLYAALVFAWLRMLTAHDLPWRYAWPGIYGKISCGVLVFALYRAITRPNNSGVSFQWSLLAMAWMVSTYDLANAQLSSTALTSICECEPIRFKRLCQVDFDLNVLSVVSLPLARTLPVLYFQLSRGHWPDKYNTWALAAATIAFLDAGLLYAGLSLTFGSWGNSLPFASTP